MLDNPYYSAELHGPWETYDAGDLSLEEGGTLRNLKLAYSIHGTLNEAKDNAILIPTWFAGTSKLMEQIYIGKGRALDPERYCIIVVNQIGSGISTSPHNAIMPQNEANFPHIRISDDVRAQHQLLTQHLNVPELALVVGGSMGAQQTYEWAVRYPNMVKRAAPIAGYASNTSHDFIFTQTLIDAIKSDANWSDGSYNSHTEVSEGLARLSRLWLVMGWSTDFFADEGWRQLGLPSLEKFQEDFITGLFTQMDPNNLLSMAWKWQRGDVSRLTNGDLAKALGRISAKTFVMPIDNDMFFKPKDCKKEQQMIANSEFKLLHSIGGHSGLFGFEPDYLDQVDTHLKELLSL
jgi:homoserine O-acetyltransferase/O-succinyltransferase